ncbi:Golgi-associated plant pathogenesis-related protein 1-like [Anableps anableps]
MADETFMREFLEAHNAYRALHHAPPLTYNSELTATAQKWADQCLEKNCLGHRKHAVDAWYSEIKDYNFTKSGYQPKTGHFTQVVWKNTQELGVGLATDGHTIFVVGQYRPSGNVMNPGYYEKNVLPKE